MQSDFERLFSGTSFENETFDKLDLSLGNFSKKEFHRCVFKNSKMQNTSWAGSRLEDCVFDGCDLANFQPKRLSLRGVEFAHSKLLGIDWSEIAVHPLVTFTDCMMRYQVFASLSLANTDFCRCVIVESTFTAVQLAKSKFRECDLAQTRFEQCDLTNVDFSTSHDVSFDPAKNKVKGARVPVETAASIAKTLGLRVVGYDR